jgi:methylaspartate mutase sigma subunit
MNIVDGGYKVVLGVIGADCHAVGNRVLDAFLASQGIEVINLGVMVSQQEFVDAALLHDAQAILVSSIYGHGELDCQGFRDLCEAQGLIDIILYVGGNLVIGKQDFSDVVRRFRAMGFDRVFQPSDSLKDMVHLLKTDIGDRMGGAIGHNSRGAGEAALAGAERI